MSETRRPSPPLRSSSGNIEASTAMGSSSALPPAPPEGQAVRGRLSSRTLADLKSSSSSLPLGTPPLSRRRSSILSFSSLDDTRHSARNFIRPGMGFDHNAAAHDEEPSHWHSSPIAFAFLPALAGLFFTNGSAFVTDMLLLALAALFLNWSVRLPWDWYHSAQAIAPASLSRRSSVTLGDVDEEDQDQDQKNDRDESSTLPPPNVAEEPEHVVEAARSLRRHELSALILTFIMPAGAAYLLHLIRGQLSRPSEGLVSDYNLTIFLLAAEIRPVRQLIRLTTNHTLHLQRVVTGDRDFAAVSAKRDKPLEDMAERLTALEDKLRSDTGPQSTQPSSLEQITSLSADMKRRYEPRLDALERAVRRYEKRATTLTLLTEQRLQSLESRLQDALSLAAIAAQSNNKPGIVVAILSTFSRCLTLPLEAVAFFLVWPIQVAETLVGKASEFVYGRPKRRSRRSDSAQPRAKSGKKKDDAYFGRHL